MSCIPARSLVGMGSIPMKARPHLHDSFRISRHSPLLILLYGQFRPSTVPLWKQYKGCRCCLSLLFAPYWPPSDLNLSNTSFILHSMLSTRTATSCGAFASKRTSAQILKAFSGLSSSTNVGTRPAYIVVNQLQLRNSHRDFSTTPTPRIKEFFPPPETENVRETRPAWPHPMSASPMACQWY